jgi:hypothetical protein
LLLTRAGVGALEVVGFVLLAALIQLLLRPATLSASSLARYAGGALVSTLAIYALSTLLACLLDEMWQFSCAMLLLGALWMINLRLPAIIPFNPLHALNVSAYAQPGAMPWASMAVSGVIAALALGASLLLLNRKEC